MRDILFRGKAAYGAWVQGDLIHRRIWQSEFEVIRVDDSGFDNYQEYEVATETIGQYTGLTDKNGKKIWEGDIVKTDKFNTPNKLYFIKYDLLMGAFIGEDNGTMYFTTFDGDSELFEVIGNVFDNPELLEVK